MQVWECCTEQWGLYYMQVWECCTEQRGSYYMQVWECCMEQWGSYYMQVWECCTEQWGSYYMQVWECFMLHCWQCNRLNRVLNGRPAAPWLLSWEHDLRSFATKRKRWHSVLAYALKIKIQCSKRQLAKSPCQFSLHVIRLKPLNFLTEIPEGQAGDNVVNTFLHAVMLSSSDLLGRVNG